MPDTSAVNINDALQLLSLIKDIPESVAAKHQDAIKLLLTQAEEHVIRARIPDHPVFAEKTAPNATNFNPKSIRKRLDAIWQKSLNQQFALEGLRELIVQVDDDDIARYGIDSLLGSIRDALCASNEDLELTLRHVPESLVAGGAA